MIEHVTKIVTFLSEEKDMYVSQDHQSITTVGIRWTRAVIPEQNVASAFVCVNGNGLITSEKKVEIKDRSQPHLTLCSGGRSTHFTG